MGLGEDSLSHQSQPPDHNLTGAMTKPFPHFGVKGGVASNPFLASPFQGWAQGSLNTYDPNSGWSQQCSTPRWPLEDLEDTEWPSRSGPLGLPNLGLDRAYRTWVAVPTASPGAGAWLPGSCKRVLTRVGSHLGSLTTWTLRKPNRYLFITSDH